MTKMTIEVPDQVAADAQGFIKAGFFRSEKEILLAALVDFLRRNRTELMDRFAHEDIEWAKREARKTA
jgi:Arc/MetJ-type ribon-helix-helix transcriptional regulator